MTNSSTEFGQHSLSSSNDNLLNLNKKIVKPKPVQKNVVDKKVRKQSASNQRVVVGHNSTIIEDMKEEDNSFVFANGQSKSGFYSA